jgi:BirA family biotin operon repressor/biotin-[acetyl-CoA-carboxylase] ligase
VANPELLLPELLAPLVRNTIFSGNIHHCVQADSTNSIALRGAALAGQHPDDTPEGAIFLAEEQTAGRGRSVHSWHSERGTGIYCSFLLRPPMTPSESLWLSLIAGVAVQDAVRETTGMAADIRWPNDLLLNDRKFCGILTELNSDSSRVNHVVVGIGINVNHRDFPPELSDIATSLARECGRDVSRLDLTAAAERHAVDHAVIVPLHFLEQLGVAGVMRVSHQIARAFPAANVAGRNCPGGAAEIAFAGQEFEINRRPE